MPRMEIALFLIVVFIAYVYFTAEKKQGALHRTFSYLLIVVMFHLIFDTATIYTVNRLEQIPEWINDILHRFFIGSMVLVLYLFYQYIAVLVEEETGKKQRLFRISQIFCGIEILAGFLLPMQYAVTEAGNYSIGLAADVCYVGVGVYLVWCLYLLLSNWKEIDKKKKSAISIALFIEFSVCILQMFNPTWLISGMGLVLMTLSFYLTLENPDILRSELREQKLSMLYLKSQVNPHFLYNTLDTIRIQAQLNGDREAADLLMKLVDFFRLSVKVEKSQVALDDELELLENYMELMCYRYPNIKCEYDVDPDLGGVLVPNFILQPIVENSLLHGLKNKGYRGKVTISALKQSEDKMEICVEDSGSGFEEGKKAAIDEMLKFYERQPAKLTGNSIGILNIQKRIKLLCGREFGLWYTENKTEGVTAHILLPVKEEKS